MSKLSDEFARIANAERQLCDEGGPVLAAIIRDIERRAGLNIAEVRVTLSYDSESRICANCTIVRADTFAQSKGRDMRRANGSPAAQSSSSR
jgi:hypothetical protein